MIQRALSGKTVAWTLAVGLVLAVMGSGGCDEYYTPPPEIAISLTAPSSSLVITSVDSTGDIVPSTLQLTATVVNTNNTAVIYSVGEDGNYIVGGNNIYGYVDSAGVYTAPAAVPTPNNNITIQAAAAAWPAQTATTTITLQNPPADTTSVTPNVVTQGLSANFTIAGYYFAQGSTVQLSGAQVGAVQFVGSSELTMPAQIQSPGMLSLTVTNPFSSSTSNALVVRSLPTSPATSSAIAIVVGAAGHDSSGNPITATKAYIPEGNSLAIVNLDANQQIGSVALPTGFNATMAAAHPAQNEVVAASSSSNLLQIVNAQQETAVESLAVPVSTTTTVDGVSCEICGLVVDSARNEAILDTAAGYFTMNLADGTTTAPLAAPASANFAYDPSTQRIYAPYWNSSGSGVNVIDLVTGTVSAVQPGNGELFGTGADSATLDPGTEVLTVGDKDSGIYLGLNFNNAQTTGGSTQVPATPFTITSGCAGAWKGMDLDFSSHTGWFANLGGCVAVASLLTGSTTGPPGAPTPIHWAALPVGPDGVPWSNTALGATQSLAVYVGPDGRAYGLAVRQDGAQLLKMDLALMAAANPPINPVDANQVDPTNVTVNTQTVSAMTYITLN